MKGLWYKNIFRTKSWFKRQDSAHEKAMFGKEAREKAKFKGKDKQEGRNTRGEREGRTPKNMLKRRM